MKFGNFEIWRLRTTVEHLRGSVHKNAAKTYDVVVPSDVRAVQKLLSDSLEALDSADNDEASFVNLKKEHDYDKSEWKEPLKALQDMLNMSANRVHELEHDQDNV